MDVTDEIAVHLAQYISLDCTADYLSPDFYTGLLLAGRFQTSKHQVRAGLQPFTIADTAAPGPTPELSM